MLHDEKKNQFKKILQGKKKYNTKKKIGFERKKLKNDETTKNKLQKSSKKIVTKRIEIKCDR
jgi:hypothetical protein